MSAARVFVGFLAVALSDLITGTLTGLALQLFGVLAAALVLITHGMLLSGTVYK